MIPRPTYIFRPQAPYLPFTGQVSNLITCQSQQTRPLLLSDLSVKPESDLSQDMTVVSGVGGESSLKGRWLRHVLGLGIGFDVKRVARLMDVKPPEAFVASAKDKLQLTQQGCDQDKLRFDPRGRYTWSGGALLPDDVLGAFQLYYPGETYQWLGCGVLEPGAAFLVSQEDPTHIITVLGTEKIPASYETDEHGRIVSVKYGHPAHMEHLEHSTLSHIRGGDQERFEGYLKALQTKGVNLNYLAARGLLDGFLKVGFEWEFWVTGLLDESGVLSLKRLFQKEHIAGLVEVNDMGEFMTPLAAAKSFARTYLRELKRCYPGLLLSTSTPPCGVPWDVDLNVYETESAFAPFIAMVNDYIDYHPRTIYSKAVRSQQALAHGYDTGPNLIKQLGLRLSTQAASHLNLGMPHVRRENGHYTTSFELMRNISNLVNSELFGTVLRGLMFSSPYITEIAPHYRGQHFRDVREVIKQDTGVSSSPTKPIKDAWHWLDNVIAAMSGSEAVFTLDRASIVKTIEHEDGGELLKGQIHGQSRWRIKETGQKTIRLEVTGPGATSILPKVRGMAYLQVISVLGLVATVRGEDALEMVARLSGMTKEEVWGDLDFAVMDYNLNGPSSLKMQTIVRKCKKILLEICDAYNLYALNENILIVVPALEALLDESDLWGFANGKGTLGGALLNFANMGMTGSRVARKVHDFQSLEAKTISSWSRSSRREKHLKQYLRGQKGLPHDLNVF